MTSTLSENVLDAGNPGWLSDPKGYHLIEKLGKGGMGVVYRAQDLNTGQFVAIKFALGNATARFQREYLQLASLQHPFIVKVYQRNAQALPPYMVMEYLPGQTLTEYRNGFPTKRLPLRLGISFLSQLTEALVYLHEQKIIHRDLKPQNLMVLGDYIKLMDFGLVRPAQVSGPLTQSGSFIGTPEYAAPEQFLDAASVTPKADLYALGVIMYEMFTGERAFKGADTPTLRDQHLGLVPLSPAQIAPEIPDALNALILSLLAKNPDARPVSAGAVQFTLNSLPLPMAGALPSNGEIQRGDVIHQRYRITSRLGQGGFGTVYKADDIVLGQPVAIKVNIDTSTEAVRRFQDEANLLGRLQHPNLPRPRAYFEEAGAQFIVMDFVPGQNLAEMLKAGPMPEADLLPWADQICGALTYLHGQTPPVIHRDIKPENIIISENRTAFLLDFGIAHIDPIASAKEIALVGTPGYAPPEQYNGKQTNARADIYALGATLYHALTGQRPPEDRLPKPAAEINPKVSVRVSRAITWAMSSQPNQRPVSASEFNNALRGLPRRWTQKRIGCFLATGLLIAFFMLSSLTTAIGISYNLMPTDTPTVTLTLKPTIVRKTKTPKPPPAPTREKATSTAIAKMVVAKATVTHTARPTQTSTLRATAAFTQSSTPAAVLPIASETFTITASFTPSDTPTITPTILTKTPTVTSTITVSRTVTITQTVTLSKTITTTPSTTLSRTITLTPSITLSSTITFTRTVKPSRTPSITPSITPSETPSPIPINLLQNPSFEIGDVRDYQSWDWFPTNFSCSRATYTFQSSNGFSPRGGNRFLATSKSNDYASCQSVYQDVTLTSSPLIGEKFTFGVWLRSHGPKNLNPFDITIWDLRGLGNDPKSGKTVWSLATTHWQCHQVVYTVGSLGTTTLRVEVYLLTNKNMDTDIDDVWLSKGELQYCP